MQHLQDGEIVLRIEIPRAAAYDFAGASGERAVLRAEARFADTGHGQFQR